MNIVKKFLPHICIILSGMMLTFVVIDQFNRARGLVDNDMTKGLLFLLGIVAIIVSCMLIGRQRREG